MPIRVLTSECGPLPEVTQMSRLIEEHLPVTRHEAVEVTCRMLNTGYDLQGAGSSEFSAIVLVTCESVPEAFGDMSGFYLVAIEGTTFSCSKMYPGPIATWSCEPLVGTLCTG